MHTHDVLCVLPKVDQAYPSEEDAGSMSDVQV